MASPAHDGRVRLECVHLILLLSLTYTLGWLVMSVTCVPSPASRLALNSSISSNETLQSPGAVFEVGFYTGTLPTAHTLAIWYASPVVKTVVWMADRSMSLTSNAYLALSAGGDLQVYDGSPTPRLMWTTNTATVSSNPLIWTCSTVYLDPAPKIASGLNNEVGLWSRVKRPSLIYANTWLSSPSSLSLLYLPEFHPKVSFGVVIELALIT